MEWSEGSEWSGVRGVSGVEWSGVEWSEGRVECVE